MMGAGVTDCTTAYEWKYLLVNLALPQIFKKKFMTKRANTYGCGFISM